MLNGEKTSSCKTWADSPRASGLITLAKLRGTVQLVSSDFYSSNSSIAVLLLEAFATGDKNKIHWAGPHLLQSTPTTISIPSPLLLTGIITVSSLTVWCLSLLLLFVSFCRSPVSGASCCMNPSPLTNPVSTVKTCLCCILIARFAYFFLSVPSLSFSSFTRPTLSRMVPPCKPGPP